MSHFFQNISFFLQYCNDWPLWGPETIKNKKKNQKGHHIISETLRNLLNSGHELLGCSDLQVQKAWNQDCVYKIW